MCQRAHRLVAQLTFHTGPSHYPPELVNGIPIDNDTPRRVVHLCICGSSPRAHTRGGRLLSCWLRGLLAATCSTTSVDDGLAAGGLHKIAARPLLLLLLRPTAVDTVIVVAIRCGLGGVLVLSVCGGVGKGCGLAWVIVVAAADDIDGVLPHGLVYVPPWVVESAVGEGVIDLLAHYQQTVEQNRYDQNCQEVHGEGHQLCGVAPGAVGVLHEADEDERPNGHGHNDIVDLDE